MRKVVLAVTQFNSSSDEEANLAKAEQLVRDGAERGANVILLHELFAGPYFPAEEDPEHFKLAFPHDGHPFLGRFSKLAAELGVVLPVSYFEKANNVHFNSMAVFDVDGTDLGTYRKHHIPDDPGYYEKYYFTPSMEDFPIFQTKFGKLGAMVCWDQWFPESARACVLRGAEILLYPSTIGSEPSQPDYSSYPHWVRVQQGHAAANMDSGQQVPLMASNRVGEETATANKMTFHGGSFIAGPEGGIVCQVGCRGSQLKDGHFDPTPAKEEGVATATFDLDELAEQRTAWGLFRDRRPDKYGVLCTHDGSTRVG